MTTTQSRIEPLTEVDQFVNGEHFLLIDGKKAEANSGKRLDVFDPATGRILTHVPDGDAVDVDRAVQAARRAFEGPWRRLTASERGRIIWRLADLIEQNLEEFAQLDAIDNGKPLTIARMVDVPLTVDVFRYMAGYTTKLEGSTYNLNLPGDWHSFSRKEPIGVIGAIIPWNFPLFMVSVKLAPALAAGNTVVLKPAEQTPLSALRFGELLEEAGFPPGVVNIVTGSGEIAGAALVAHPDVDKITFTGSTSVGKQIARAVATDLKKVSLEMGGKSANLVFADADLDVAIQGAAQAIFFNHGQACVAGARLFVESSVFDEVVSGISAIATGMTLGPALDPSSEMGPLVSKEQQQRVLGYLEAGSHDGARVAGAGAAPDNGGYYVAPTVLVDVRNEMSVQREEIFGPVLTAVPFTDVDDAIAQANDTSYGLAAGCFTTNLSTAHKVSNALQAGNIYVNCWGVTDPSAPFGGYKQSGWGREFGREVLEYYTETKAVHMKL
ncbi:MAG: betaine-aldehyde dehydrogenase [Pseudonocardiales bacterium]|nr:MAG: betaine-aldehyde dehydrogenase [Pseudonocardiales bacterium]